MNNISYLTVIIACFFCVGSCATMPKKTQHASQPQNMGVPVALKRITSGSLFSFEGRDSNGELIKIDLSTFTEVPQRKFQFGSSYGYRSSQESLNKVSFSRLGETFRVSVKDANLIKNPDLTRVRLLEMCRGEVWMIGFTGGDGERYYAIGFIFDKNGYVCMVPDKHVFNRLDFLLNSGVKLDG
jgi:hypothetical protein